MSIVQEQSIRTRKITNMWLIILDLDLAPGSELNMTEEPTWPDSCQAREEQKVHKSRLNV